MDYS